MDDLTPQTRQEAYMAAMAGEGVELPEAPLTRREKYMAKFLGQDVETPTPVSREDQYWEKIIENGGGGGGTEGYTLAELPLEEVLQSGNFMMGPIVARLEYASKQTDNGIAAIAFCSEAGDYRVSIPYSFTEGGYDDNYLAFVFATAYNDIIMKDISDAFAGIGIDNVVAINVELDFVRDDGGGDWTLKTYAIYGTSPGEWSPLPDVLQEAILDNASLRIVAMFD